MANNFKKTYKFAGYTSTFLTVLLTLILSVFFTSTGELAIGSCFCFLCFVMSFHFSLSSIG